MSQLFLTSPIKIPLGKDVADVKPKLAKALSVSEKDIVSVRLHRQSVDARDKDNVHFVCSYVVECAKPPKNARPFAYPQDVLAPFDARQSAKNLSADICGSQNHRKHCVVIGGGPAGLFLARFLSQNGIRVTVIERGADVEKRKKTVQRFFDGGSFDAETNVQFGLGGAGTFSDGKLTTGISSPLIFSVFNEFVRRGAPQDILTSATPHIGTDNLVNVVASLRDEICKYGGQFLFGTNVCDLLVKNGKAEGVDIVETASGKHSLIFADCVALCCGHSARELFVALSKRNVPMQFKPFAVGLRVEHTRSFIDRTQYGELFAAHRDLGAANYKLVNNLGDHGCYSFCMCPGGMIVPANSQPNTVVVNGMSNHARDAQNSNSALVVTVSREDVAEYGFGSGVFAGMDFQQALEETAYNAAGGNYRAPYQNVTDFLAGKVSAEPDVSPSYPRGVAAVDFRTVLPQKICDILCQSLQAFDRRMKAFAKCGTLTGVETRTSSPIKILRSAETLQSSGVTGLFPVGEGAGYAGGIVSSAVDGLKSAQKIFEYLKNS